MKSNELRFQFLSKELPENKACLKIKKVIIGTVFFLQDISITILLGIGVVLLNYYYNDGRIRAFSILSIFVGFVVYKITVGKISVRLLSPLFVFLVKCINATLYFLILPIKTILSKSFVVCIKIYSSVKKHIAKRKNMRYNVREEKRLENLSKLGFLDFNMQKELKNET